MPVRLVIIGGGPAGNSAATHAARLGADVTLVERDVIGGAAHLWDCIPSKAMIATGGAMSFARRSELCGLHGEGVPALDAAAVKARLADIEGHLHRAVVDLLESQGVRMVLGAGRLKGPHEVVVDTDEGMEELEADAILLSTGSRPRVPAWAGPDGERVLTTRQAYQRPQIAGHVAGNGARVTHVA